MAVSVARLPAAIAPAAVPTPTIAAIRFGAAVYCRDGRAGKVARLALDPDRHVLTYLVISTGGPFGKQVVVPTDRIVQCSDDRVDLKMFKDELHRLPEFQELHEVARDVSYHPIRRKQPQAICFFGDGPILLQPGDWVPAGWLVRHRHRGLPAEVVPVRRGTAVYQGFRRLGRLDQVLLDDDHRTVTDLLVKPSGLGEGQVVVPFNQVEFIDENGVWLEFDPRAAGSEIAPRARSAPGRARA